MAKHPKKHWFWAWTVLSTVHKSRQDDPTAPCKVWSNCIIIRASDEHEALRKAKQIGQSEAGDTRGSLRLDGEPAICKFLGVVSLGLIWEPLRDGAEICWRQKRCKQSTALKLPTAEATLLSLAKKELGHILHRDEMRNNA